MDNHEHPTNATPGENGTPAPQDNPPQLPEPAQPAQPAQPAPPAQPAQYQQQAPVQRAVAPPPNGDSWSTSLVDCSPLSTCLLATFVPCILIGQTADRMRDPTAETTDGLNSDCFCFTAEQLCTGTGWVNIMMMRTEIREQFGIKSDDIVSDCCVAFWCPYCALIQQDNEVKIRTGAARLVTQGYQAESGMQLAQSGMQLAQSGMQMQQVALGDLD